MKISMKTLKEYGIITLGVILLAISLEYFYYPNDIAAGGVSGLALVVNKITGISQGMFMNVANVILFALAFWLIGGSFGGRSIYAAFGLSITISLIESFLPTFAVTENMLLATIFGSVVGAFGIALVFSQNSSTGGTAIVAKILNKYLHIEIGKSLLCADCVVVVCALLVFGVDKALFGLIGVFIMGILIFMCSRLQTSITAFAIISVAAGIIYFLAVLTLGVFSREELKSLPMSGLLIKINDKINGGNDG